MTGGGGGGQGLDPARYEKERFVEQESVILQTLKKCVLGGFSSGLSNEMMQVKVTEAVNAISSEPETLEESKVA